MSSYPHLSRMIEGFFIDKRGQGRSDDTLHEYHTTLKRFLEFTKDPPINEITSKTITDFFNYLEDYRFTPGRPGNPGTKKLAPKTIFNYKTGLSSFFAYVEEEHGLNSPKLPKREKKEKPVLPFSTDEVMRMLKACEHINVEPSLKAAYKYPRQTRLRDKALILVLFDTGIRSSELCNIRFRDIDFENNRIKVTGKGVKERYIQFGKNAARHLYKYQIERFPKEKPYPDDYLFVDRDGMRPLNRSSVLSLINSIGKKAGVKNAHPHRFRHTFAIEFLRNGGDVLQLQELLGHTTYEMCKRYVTLATNDLKEMHRRASPGDHLLRV